jgi:hypothetical protein
MGTSFTAYRALFDLLQTNDGKFETNFKSLANGEGRLSVFAQSIGFTVMRSQYPWTRLLYRLRSFLVLPVFQESFKLHACF